MSNDMNNNTPVITGPKTIICRLGYILNYNFYFIIITIHQTLKMYYNS